MSTSVKVLVRVRPLNGKEGLSGDCECVAVNGASVQVVANANRPPEASVFLTPRLFTFDYAFDAASTQQNVFEAVVPLVSRFVEGFNVTVLAYGQTGSGKTWTMGTGLELMGSELRGIVPRAIDLIFENIQQKRDTECSLAVSFLELYNEELVDLLNPVIRSHASSRPNTASSSHSNNSNSSTSHSSNPNQPNIREDAHGNIVWSNVREEPVSCPQDLFSCLQRGSLCRSTGSTDMNAASSRSHAIFSIVLRQKEKVSSGVGDVDVDGEGDPERGRGAQQNLPQTYRTITSKFHFVDLAGSERLKRTNAEGDRKKEGISINQGLLALGNCISALGDESRKPGTHVPYRDSKLTRMLQDSLGGNSQTLMIACVSPSESSYGETVSTLTYANRARNIKNKMEVLQEFTGAGSVSAAAEKEIRGLRALVADLREEVLALRNGTATSSSSTASRSNANSTTTTHAVAAHERDFQIHLQEERELASALEVARQEMQIARFEADR
ncbi:UNVERIFIED_CONTAM: Kinesin-like protein kif21b, partial [Siphonaria sp. JEL0065]